MPYSAPALPEPDERLGVFVAPRGRPNNPGTRAAPLDSPRRAVELATRDGRAVFLAAGEYVEEVATRVSLYGGYAPDFAELDPERYVTRIAGPDGGHATSAVSIEAGEVVLHGLSLRGGKSKFAAAVTIHGEARATLVRNVLHGGGRGPHAGGFTYSQGVNVPSSSRPTLTLLGNSIHGGLNQYSWGIDGLGPGCVVEQNTIFGGDADTPNSSTCGIRASGGFTLRNNTIDAGRGVAGARGLSFSGGGVVVVGNTFRTPRGNRWDNLLVGATDQLQIEGNTLDGVPDSEFFAFARRLTPRSWTFNQVEGDQWSYDRLTLNPWGWLEFSSDSASEPTGGGYAGPSQNFSDFLRSGPANPATPAPIAEELRALLLAAGVKPEA